MIGDVRVVADAAKDRRLQGVFTSFRADTPWVELVIDRTQAKDRSVSIDDVRTTLETNLGSYYINDFNRFGRTWQVNVQADQKFRTNITDIYQLQVKNQQGQMVRLGTLLEVRDTSGPVMVLPLSVTVPPSFKMAVKIQLVRVTSLSVRPPPGLTKKMPVADPASKLTCAP